MTWCPALDGSYANLSPERAAGLNAEGYKLWVQCAWTAAEAPSTRVTNLRNAYNAGMAIAIYISLSSAQSGAYHFAKGIEGIPADLWDALKFIAIDVELPGIRYRDIKEALEQCRAWGKKPVVYTNYNSWRNHVEPSNPPAPRWDDGVAELWNAFWDVNPDVDFPSLPFGDWTPDEVLMEQWSGGTSISDVFVDQNTVNAEKLGLLTPPVEEPAQPQPAPTGEEFPSIQVDMPITQDAARAALELLKEYIG